MNEKQVNILVVDDDKDILLTAEIFLKRHYNKVVAIADPNDISYHMANEQFDVVLLDMNFSIGLNTGQEGLHWLSQIISVNPHAVVIMMTAYGDIELSVKALKLGATDFVLKPWKNEKLLATLNSAALLNQSRQQVLKLNQRQQELTHQSEHPQVVGNSQAIQQVLKLVSKSAQTDVNILILGENGTGKEVIANEIFRQSTRAKEIMLSVDLGAIPENLFESELFGHVKGAFTDAYSDRAGRFQAASGGTLFLDEIGNLPLHLQAKLLRVIENKEITPVGSDKVVKVDVRLICATNRSLQQLVDDGLFRADLYYRINTVQIELPALRQRPEDIPLFLQYFLEKYAHKYKFPTKIISPSAVKLLSQYEWPGNVRELAHAVERALILSDQEQLTEQDFLLSETNQAGKNILNDCNLERIEKLAINHAIDKHQGNISHAAEELGITRTSLYRRLKKYLL